MSTPLYIDTPAALAKLCQQLKTAPHFALDTEFLREKTYSARLCLIQVATEQLVACIDPLQLDNLDPFMELLFDRGITKILHSARQDMEIFHDLTGKLPGPVFDTQIAATLIGLPDQCGYANLIKHLLGVELDKAQTRTDWSRRPLDAAQLRYAADDVRYLIQAWPLIMQKLRDAGREDWLQEDFLALENPELYRLPLENLWQKVSGHARLKGRQLAILRQLAAWREQQARERNRPRKWIISDDSLIALARMAPTQLAQLEKIRGLNNSHLKNAGREILAEIETAQALPREQWPRLPAKKTGKQDEILIDLLMCVLKLQAQRHGISPAILGTRKEVEKLLHSPKRSALMQGWRRHIAGEQLIDVLEGKQELKVQDRRLQLLPVA